MIDQALIQETAEHIQDSLKKSKEISKQLSFIENVLPLLVINKIKDIIASDPDWKKVKGSPSERSMIDWISESIIEELHEVGEMITKDIKQYYDIDGIKFQALQLWKDTPGYQMTQHQDNPVIDVAMQIYLFSDADDEGTTFIFNDQEVDIPFKQNTGYLLWKKSNEERILHRPTNQTHSKERITLYLTWSRFGKQAPDADDPAAFL